MLRALKYLSGGLACLAVVAAFLYFEGLPSTGATGGPLLAFVLIGIWCVMIGIILLVERLHDGPPKEEIEPKWVKRLGQRRRAHTGHGSCSSH